MAWLRRALHWLIIPLGMMMICAPAMGQNADGGALTTGQWVTIVFGLITTLVGLHSRTLKEKTGELERRIDVMQAAISTSNASVTTLRELLLSKYHDAEDMKNIMAPINDALRGNTAVLAQVEKQVMNLQARFDAHGISGKTQ